MTTSSLSIGLLGAGRIGKVHAAAITGTPGAHLTAVADAFPDPATALAEQYGAAVRSIDEIMARTTSTPSSSRRRPTSTPT